MPLTTQRRNTAYLNRQILAVWPARPRLRRNFGATYLDELLTGLRRLIEAKRSMLSGSEMICAF
jgi:hypothetical protein